MGGFFSAPSPPSPPPPISLPSPIDPAVEETKQRQDLVDRQRRGRAGLVATSERGLMGPNDAPGHKTLLGE